MRLILLTATLLAATLLLASPAPAFVQYVNGRLDGLLDGRGDPPIVVRVEIRGVAVRADLHIGGPRRHVALVVREVLLGDDGLRDEERVICITSFAWPEALVPLKVGERPVLILDPKGETIRCVAPCGRDRVGRQQDAESVRRLLVEEAFAALGREGRAARRLALVRLIAPAVGVRDAERLRPLLERDAEDLWVRRAALGAVIGATQDPGRIEEAVRDLRACLRLFRIGDMIVHPDGQRWSALAFSFHPYDHLLRVGVSEAADRAAAAFLPLYRVIEEETRDRPKIRGWRWTNAIQPLARTGNEEDLRALHDAYVMLHGKDEDSRYGSRRQECLRGMGRILGLELATWSGADFLRHEAEQHRRVREAIVERGILPR